VDLRRLRHFSELADTLSFRDAARRLHLTQPALTRSIAALEGELGVQLFERDKRHVSLTPAGERLLCPARELLHGADELRRTASELVDEPGPVLRVGVFGPGLERLAPTILSAFRERHPEVTLHVAQAPCGNDISALTSGEVDVALVCAPVTVLYPDATENALVEAFVEVAVEAAAGRPAPVPRAEALA
jgi:DNA-binding transcriptional LysR family regulator